MTSKPVSTSTIFPQLVVHSVPFVYKSILFSIYNMQTEKKQNKRNKIRIATILFLNGENTCQQKLNSIPEVERRDKKADPSIFATTCWEK